MTIIDQIAVDQADEVVRLQTALRVREAEIMDYAATVGRLREENERLRRLLAEIAVTLASVMDDLEKLRTL